MNRHIEAFILAIGLAIAPVALLAPTAALGAQASAIVDTGYVADASKRGAIVWDTRSAAAYKEGHIPGAVNIGDVGQVLRDENREDYINPYVYFALLTLQYFNAPNAKVYHGGIDDWKAAGQPVATEPSKLAAVALKLQLRPELLVDTTEVLRKMRDPKVQIVDARTPEEYRGEDIRALRGGHIPGALPIHYMENWVDPDTPAKLEKKLVANKDGMNLKPREQLKALYSKLDPDKETIVYCQSGVRASETATVLQDIGFKNVRVYDSSWIGYGNTLEAPAEDVTFFNVGNMQAKMNAMQKRLDALEKELAATKAAK